MNTDNALSPQQLPTDPLAHGQALDLLRSYLAQASKELPIGIDQTTLLQRVTELMQQQIAGLAQQQQPAVSRDD